MKKQDQALIWYDDDGKRRVVYTTIEGIRDIDGHLEGAAIDPRTGRQDHVGYDDDNHEWQFV